MVLFSTLNVVVAFITISKPFKRKNKTQWSKTILKVMNNEKTTRWCQKSCIDKEERLHTLTKKN